MGDRTRTVVIAVVTTVWALNFVAGLIPAIHHTPDQSINAVFMAIVGGLFAIGRRGDQTDQVGKHSARREEPKQLEE